MGTGARRSAASHQCRLTDGSIQLAGPRRLNAWYKAPREKVAKEGGQQLLPVLDTPTLHLHLSYSARLGVFRAGTVLALGYLNPSTPAWAQMEGNATLQGRI